MTGDAKLDELTKLATELGYVLVPESILTNGKARDTSGLQVARDIAQAHGHVVVPAEDWVPWPSYPTMAIFTRLHEICGDGDTYGFKAFCGDSGNWVWLLGELRKAAMKDADAPSSRPGHDPVREF